MVLSEVCDAINAVDASGAHVHMSSVGICALLTRAGYAVVMQISCRDKNRIAIQGDVLGAAAMGVANILCLTGDGVQCGDQPEAKPVFDLDSITPARHRPHHARRGPFPVRAASSPRRRRCSWAPPSTRSCRRYDYRPIHFAKKIAAGAQFVQTQYCYDVPLLKRFMARVREQGLHEKCFILVGVGPLASAKTARWMRSSVPGVHIPDEIVDRHREGRARPRSRRRWARSSASS